MNGTSHSKKHEIFGAIKYIDNEEKNFYFEISNFDKKLKINCTEEFFEKIKTMLGGIIGLYGEAEYDLKNKSLKSFKAESLIDFSNKEMSQILKLIQNSEIKKTIKNMSL